MVELGSPPSKRSLELDQVVHDGSGGVGGIVNSMPACCRRSPYRWRSWPLGGVCTPSLTRTLSLALTPGGDHVGADDLTDLDAVEGDRGGARRDPLALVTWTLKV